MLKSFKYIGPSFEDSNKLYENNITNLGQHVMRTKIKVPQWPNDSGNKKLLYMWEKKRLELILIMLQQINLPKN